MNYCLVLEQAAIEFQLKLVREMKDLSFRLRCNTSQILNSLALMYRDSCPLLSQIVD